MEHHLCSFFATYLISIFVYSTIHLKIGYKYILISHNKNIMKNVSRTDSFSLNSGVKVSRSNLITLSLLFMSLLGWYYNSSNTLGFIIGFSSPAMIPHNLSYNMVLIVALCGSLILSSRLDQTILIGSWAIISFIGALLIFLFPFTYFRLLIYYLTGAAYGLAQICALAHFWKITEIAERGRVGGITVATALVLFPLFGYVSRSLGFLATTLTNVFLCAVAFIAFNLIKRSQAHDKAKRGIRRERRTIFFYLLPWTVFCLVNATFARSISLALSMSVPADLSNLPYFFQIISGCGGAIVAGILSDISGRKLSIASGLVLYGCGLALSGLANTIETILIVFIINGFSWGFFTVLFIFVIWGDLSVHDGRNYFMGLFPYYTSIIIGQIVTTEVLGVPLEIASLASCAIVFLSNIPLLSAPDLLPLKFHEERSLRIYIKKIRKGLKQRHNYG
jgi:hypothetical protein